MEFFAATLFQMDVVGSLEQRPSTYMSLYRYVSGYSLEAKKTCKAKGRNATLIVANENVLRHIHPFAFHKMVDLTPEKTRQGSKIESIDVFFVGQDSVILW